VSKQNLAKIDQLENQIYVLMNNLSLVACLKLK